MRSFLWLCRHVRDEDGEIKKAMSSPSHEKELQNEVELLRRRLRENDALIRDAFRLMEEMCAAIESLKQLRESMESQ